MPRVWLLCQLQWHPSYRLLWGCELYFCKTRERRNQIRRRMGKNYRYLRWLRWILESVATPPLKGCSGRISACVSTQPSRSTLSHCHLFCQTGQIYRSVVFLFLYLCVCSVPACVNIWPSSWTSSLYCIFFYFCLVLTEWSKLVKMTLFIHNHWWGENSPLHHNPFQSLNTQWNVQCDTASDCRNSKLL